jgi:Amt family ammonium transporter
MTMLKMIHLLPVLLLIPGTAFAQTPAGPDSGDTAWMLSATALVLLMTIPGLALFYGGMVRKKNVLATLAQSFGATALMSLLWLLIGYSLAFKPNADPGMNAFIGGLDYLFLQPLTVNALTGTIPESLFIVFQMTFAIITPALIAGAVADRMKYSAFLWFIALWLVLVYAPVAHWVWGGGWLSSMGALDFAGGAVVHLNAGTAALVATLVLGKRHGYGAENMSPHNLVFSLIGASLLWVGWFGFNAGSALTAGASAAMAMLVTQVAAAAAALSWMAAEWLITGKPSVLGMISGAVGGLVAITPAAGFVDPLGALFIGIAAGIVCYLSAVWLKKALGYDDSLDAFGVHGVGGALGAILTGVFADSAINGLGRGWIADGNIAQLWPQLVSIVAVFVYCAIVSFIILKLVDLIVGLRVPREVEIEGLDINLHGETLHN